VRVSAYACIHICEVINPHTKHHAQVTKEVPVDRIVEVVVEKVVIKEVRTDMQPFARMCVRILSSGRRRWCDGNHQCIGMQTREVCIYLLTANRQYAGSRLHRQGGVPGRDSGGREGGKN
jgi:hypothetical protein